MKVNKKFWEHFNDIQLNEFAIEIFDFYRKKGFPYYTSTIQERYSDFRKLQALDYRKYLKDDVVTQTMHGLSLAWYYHPHAWEVQCNNLLTPMDIFNDDEKFLKAILKRLKFGTNISANGIRKVLKIFSGAQAVSNFRPSAAGCIYDHYAGDGVVWDMSCGFGGRLLGAVTSNSVKKYIGTDPSTKTYEGLCQFVKEFKGTHDKVVELHQLGSEAFKPDKNSLDLCFTSPPYFNCEKYADEDTQSFMKYDTKEKWLNGFFWDTILNCHWGLKNNGTLIINIASVKSYPTICEDIVRIVEGRGFIHEKTLQYSLSAINRGGFKYEPMFVFRKV
jgi:hypothetical protein